MLNNDPTLNQGAGSPDGVIQNLFQYSNGWGHLIMSVVFLVVGCLLIFIPTVDPSYHGIGISIILTVSGAWFIPGAAKQVAAQVQHQLQQPQNTVSSSGPQPPVISQGSNSVTTGGS